METFIYTLITLWTLSILLKYIGIYNNTYVIPNKFTYTIDIFVLIGFIIWAVNLL